MYTHVMSEWNYTKCAKPFETEAAAREFMATKDFAGHILKRETGYAAVCPTYPNGYYPDATLVASFENSKGELAAWQSELAITPSDCC